MDKEQFEALLTVLKDINEALHFIATQGILITHDDTIQEN